MEKSSMSKQCVKEARWQDLSDSLLTSSTDIVLVCKKKKYPAHRFILEASSSYFKTMFHSGLKELKSRQVHFKDMEPETLEAILAYIYKGEVDLIKTEVQIKNVLSASHLMNLTKLFEYCCFMLGESLSKDNFYEIQQIVSTYNITLNENILAFVVVYGNEKVKMDAFQDLSLGQMKTMLSFAKIKRLCFDKLLILLVHWLQYDLKSREKEARELFAYVDGQLVSKSTILSLLMDDKITSEIISQLLKDVALACTLGFNACTKEIEVSSNHFRGKKLNITFLNGYHGDSFLKYLDIHQFNVNTMTWLPSKRKPLCTLGNSTAASVCYFSGTVHMLGGGLGQEHILYDIAYNELESRKRSDRCFGSLTGAGLCVFKNKLYVVGGAQSDDTTNTRVYYTELGAFDRWVKAPAMNVQRYFPTMLTTSDYIYVIGGRSSLSQLYVEYLKAKARNWTVINCESVPTSVSSRHCLVFNNQLYAVGLSNGHLECWVHYYDKWQCMYSMQAPSHCRNVVNVCQFPDLGMEVMLLSVGNPCLPTHAWKPFEGKFQTLEPVKGLCAIPNYCCKQYLYCADL